LKKTDYKSFLTLSFSLSSFLPETDIDSGVDENTQQGDGSPKTGSAETDIDSGVDENTQQGDGSPKTGSGTDHTQN